MSEQHLSPPLERFYEDVAVQLQRGGRFRGLFASAHGSSTRLSVVVAASGSFVLDEVTLPDGQTPYRSLSALTPAAAWYEREIHDLFGIEPIGAAALHPLVFPFVEGEALPRPGSAASLGLVEPDITPLPAHLHGEGTFTISYGPVRSGVFEAIEFLVETSGEDIPYLRTRVFYKHRGVESRFDGMSIDDGALLAERTEGVASVAHAIAYCQAIEEVADVEAPPRAQYLRVVHAEMERIANHLESAVRHTEAAGQAVAYARLSWHKERVQRLRAELSGSRFGRGVVVPGGVSGPLQLSPVAFLAALRDLEEALRADVTLLMGTPSFLDRLRGTGVLPRETVRSFAALGPVARGSGLDEDVRFTTPYGAYRELGHRPLALRGEGDALARQRVRFDEVWQSLHLIRQALDHLDGGDPSDLSKWRVEVGSPSGRALGWTEAPQGELLYLVDVDEGRLTRVKPRSASFQNLALFPSAFPKDILTDFAFIEASFGVSVAGVAL